MLATQCQMEIFRVLKPHDSTYINLPDGEYGKSDEEEGSAGGGPGREGMMGMDGVAPGGGGGVTAGCSVSDVGGRTKIAALIRNTSITACDHSADTLEKLLLKY